MNKTKKIFIRTSGICLVVLIFLIIVIPLPKPLFQSPHSTTLYSKNGKLLNVSIADDEQWRFPESDSIPEKYKKSLMLFEDEYFYNHPGVNPVSIFRAIRQNITAGRTVSGGSTISMQVVRMAYGNQSRTKFQKLKEILAAFKLELFYSKEEILKSYADNAPFGGNIVGISAASYKYFGRPPHQLSWAEAATLAILPNDPSSIFPGKNQPLLLKKRNTLLEKLAERKLISEEELYFAKEESLPSGTVTLPNHASHLLTRSKKEGNNGTKVNTTLDERIQIKSEEILNEYSNRLSQNQIHNAAAIIINIEDGSTIAYIGNSNKKGDHGQHVDIVTSKRSPGSLLKPFLYALSVDKSLISPYQLLPDIPVFYNGFAPKNFDKKYRGAVYANDALASSLNVPFVHLLQDYGYEQFHIDLKKIGFKSFNKPADHYGLSIILGGAETTLWELSAAYAGMKRAMDNYLDRPLNKGYSAADYHPNFYLQKSSKESEPELDNRGILNPSSVWFTLDAMQMLNRPDSESGWERFASSQKIAWKTGTSYGFKDAWAIGLTDNHLVGVWIGNADGEGRPGLTGVSAAAPLMFKLFDVIGGQLNLIDPFGQEKIICVESGMPASKICTNTTTIALPGSIKETAQCTYHKLVHLDKVKERRVNSSCYSVSEIQNVPFFILPPVQAYYFKQFNPGYRSLPSFSEDCEQNQQKTFFDLIYPNNYVKVHIPKEQAGNKGQTIFEAAHENSNTKIYWHIDSEYLGYTIRDHKMGISATPGKHLLTVIDENGNQIKQLFEVIE
ncbi:penicillin-binding protein 1C [Marinigracilibium pacificum]|uniref:peptidoglycan glycosyltransferase n=1 Tax=Marinigracilibium pacificum TaxID=2729599 RepID=A0A848J7C6_9BACT|nr:penicillin-binding protein 1C [Marinigracilibium pacificum]NMM50400.1 penicillin-binding protein 1C [Marinigracilibium pacificum]